MFAHLNTCGTSDSVSHPLYFTFARLIMCMRFITCSQLLSSCGETLQNEKVQYYTRPASTAKRYVSINTHHAYSLTGSAENIKVSSASFATHFYSYDRRGEDVLSFPTFIQQGRFLWQIFWMKHIYNIWFWTVLCLKQAINTHNGSSHIMTEIIALVQSWWNLGCYYVLFL